MRYIEPRHRYAVTVSVQHTQTIHADTEQEAIELAQDSLPPNIQLDLHALQHHEDAETHWDADIINPDEHRADMHERNLS